MVSYDKQLQTFYCSVQGKICTTWKILLFVTELLNNILGVLDQSKHCWRAVK